MAIVHGLPLLVVFVSMAQLDGSVTIIQDDVDDGHDFTECGEKLVLTCTIDNYLSSSTMTWQNENSSTILVSCSGSTCNLNPSVINVYNKSEDTNTGTFNLIIPTVTRDISGISYLCENGFVRDSIVVEVQDYRPILNESSSTELTVRSGCIDESVDVEFKWKKIKASDSSKTDDYDPTYINTDETIDKTFCTLDTACGFSNSVTQERSIKTERGDENDYYLKAVIFYNGVPMESVQTTYAYKIEGMKTSPPPQQTKTKASSVSSALKSETTTITLISSTLYKDNTTHRKSEENVGGTHYGLWIWIGLLCLFICSILALLVVYLVRRHRVHK